MKKLGKRLQKGLAEIRLKEEFVRALLERPRWAAAIAASRGDLDAQKRVTALEKRLMRMSVDDLKDLDKERATSRLRSRYGKSCLQKEKPERGQRKKSDERIAEIEEARKRTNKLFRNMRRRKTRRKPQQYSLKMLVNTTPDLKYNWGRMDKGNW